MRLWSNQLAEGGTLPQEQVANVFGHHGGNTSPQLAWDGIPEDAKSLVLTLYDPDAATGSGFWHWIVVDIPATAKEVPASASGESLPAGCRVTRNDLGTCAYAGAAPPPGPPHRYVFTLRALSIDKLPVPDDASGALVGFVAGGHVLETATLTVTYGA